jgi:hypothetical protein
MDLTPALGSTSASELCVLVSLLCLVLAVGRPVKAAQDVEAHTRAPSGALVSVPPQISR